MGLIDGGTLGYWQIISPVAGKNWVTNPSFEKDTAGWAQTNATLVRTAGAGEFGAYGGRMLASAANGKTSTTLASVTSGTANVGSTYVRADSPLVQIKVTIGASSSVQFHPGDGLFHRVETPVTAPSTTTPVIEIIDTRTSAWTNVDIDGVQFENGVSVASTYMDGDQDACAWDGAPHASTSSRDGRDGRGGQIVALDAVGLKVTNRKGIGAPPIDVATQTLALGDGDVYQRSRSQARVITLESLIVGDMAGMTTFHALRRTITDLFRPDSRAQRGPIVLRYAAAAIAKRIETYYQSGLEMDTLDAADEKPEIKVLAPDPSWRGETEQSATVASLTTVTPVSGLALLSPSGVWSSMGGGATQNPAGPPAIQAAIRLLDGRVAVAGLLDFGGTAANDNLAVWDGTSWATLGGNAPSALITGLTLDAAGRLFASGATGTIGGITHFGIAVWTPATNTWAAFNASITGSKVVRVTYDPSTGYLWAFGVFTAIGGVSATNLAYYNGTTWVAATTGLSGTANRGPYIGPDGRVYIITSTGINVWSGTSWSMWALGTNIFTLFTANGRLYAGGNFSTIAGVAANSIAMTSGAGWQPLAQGVSGEVDSLAVGPNGTLYVAGQAWTSVGGLTPLDSLAVWNGSLWSTLPVNAPDSSTHSQDYYGVVGLSDGSLLLGWTTTSGTAFGTSLLAQAITSVTNSGSANVYPIIEMLATGAVTMIANLTTGQVLNFAGCVLAAGELARLDLRPGRKTFSTIFRSLISTVQPGSDLATFCLAPGANQIAVYADGGTITMRWQPRYWTAD